jgi:hypothetical protein
LVKDKAKTRMKRYGTKKGERTAANTPGIIELIKFLGSTSTPTAVGIVALKILIMLPKNRNINGKEKNPIITRVITTDTSHVRKVSKGYLIKVL